MRRGRRIGAAVRGRRRGIGAAYYFGTEPAALDVAARTRLLEHLDARFLSVWGPAVAGALLVAAGQVVLAVALWRAGTVPRWIPVLLATIPVTFVLDTSGVLGLLVEVPMAAGALGVAWQLWVREAPPEPLDEEGAGYAAVAGPASR